MKTKPGSLLPALSLGLILVATSPLLAAPMTSGNYTFQFDLAGGDRDYNFGSRPTTGQFDVNNLATFQAQSSGASGHFVGTVTNATTWALLNDPQPTVINASAPTGSDNFIVSSGATLTLRTFALSLSSGTSGDLAYGGFLFGLNGTGNTASGFAAVLRRTVGTNAISGLEIRNFTSGALGTVIASSSNFTYDGSADVFLSLQASATSYSFSVFANASISGSGNDSARLSSADFATATPLAITSGGALAGFSDGYTGLLFVDTGAAAAGSIDVGNFQLQVVPEPGSLAMVLLGLGAAAIFRRRRLRAAVKA